MSNYNNTLFVGKVLIRYNSIDSTNLAAQKLLNEQSVTEGTCILAKNQTAGVGQRGNAWVSEKDSNVLCSIILKPKFIAPSKHFCLNIISSLAICDTLNELDIHNTNIKWPNDIYIGDNKVAGILIQNSINNTQIQHSIIGIGLNVNQINFDPNLPNPTSIRLTSKKKHDIEAIASSVFKNLERRYLQLKSQGIEMLESEYLNQLYKRNEVATFLINEKEVPGIIKGIDDHGKLLIQIDAKVKVFNFQEVRLVV